MLIAIGLIAGFASIVILTVLFNFLKSDNKKRLCTLTWLVSLLVSATSLAIAVSKTYIPDTMAIVGRWVSVSTGMTVGNVYDVVKSGSGTHPFLMFLLVILGFTMYGFIFAGSIATGRNKARHAVKIPSKILSFLIWFFLCSWLGVMTVGIMPMILAKKSSTPSDISRNMKML